MNVPSQEQMDFAQAEHARQLAEAQKAQDYQKWLNAQSLHHNRAALAVDFLGRVPGATNPTDEPPITAARQKAVKVIQSYLEASSDYTPSE